jgi:hypothetical protein
MDPKYGFDGSGRPYVRHEKFQPLTGEAVRLGHGMALNLGTRGFMYDKWQYQDDLSRGDTAYRVPHPDDVSDPSKYGREIFSPTYFPGYVTEDSTAHAMDANAQVSVDSLFNSEHLGGDYFTTTDRININDWTPLATLGAEMELSRFMSGTPGARIYAGRRSVRHETKWWHDLVTDTVTAFRHGTAPSNAQLFMKTRPIAWFGKGYRILVNGDTSRFGSWLPGFADSLAVYRWTRTSPTDTTLRYEEEPRAEQLYDLVLLDTSEAGYTGDQCILAVTNRRTSPMLFNASMLDSVEWVSSYEHDTLTRGSRPDLRYRQVGARRIMLPLHHAVSGSGPWLLRVRELHPHADSALAMDTIVGARTTLALDLRPGETKYLHITRQRAHDTAAAGYLAFSTQNKLVATEVVNAGGNGYTGQVRYHMVYHRKRIGSGEQGPWTVYYQRSVPQARDAAPDVAGMQWETPIALSLMTMLSTPSTTGLSHTRYYGVDSTTYEELVHDDTSDMQDCSCGFPSIVVRDTQQYKPVAYVVYACEDMWAMTNRNNYFHIVENAFADTETLNAMALETNGRSLAIAPKDLPHDGGLDTLKSLARYGTPVVNASADSTMYYAWSAANMGIGVGRKSIRERFFRGPQAMAEVPMPDIVTGTGDTLFGGGARLPSVNVYSNIAHGRTDVTLVWQEGDAYPHVRYTRLVPGINGAIARMLPDFVEMSYYAYSPSGIPTNAAAAVAVVGGTRAETAELPTVVRSLQTDTLSMFIRDSTVNLNNIVRYEHETVSWEEYVVAEQRGKARYNHFIDRTGYGADELHYWQANATGGIGLSVFHPVVTNGVVRIDSLVWQGTVGGSLQTYHDSLRVLRGNLSDSSLIVNYSILPNAAYTALRAQRLAGNASYWTGMAGFAGLKTQQITIRRIPGVPGIYGITYHDDTLQAGGAWPHLSMRQREDNPKGMASVRRTLQHTAGAPPNLIASAEQLYKPTSDETSSRLRRMHSGGLDVAGERFVARIDLSDGRSLTMLPVYTTRIPADYDGTEAIRHTMAALSTSSQEFLSDAFMVDGAEALQLVTTGGLRDAVDVTLEEVDRERLGTSAATMRGATSRVFTLVPAAADDRRPDRQVRAMYYLSGAEETFYRVRVRYHGDAPVVYRTETILDAAPEDMERATGDNVHTIDLRAMRGHTVPANGLLVTPNPSAGDVTIILPPGRRDQALMWVYDAVGKLVTHVDVSQSQRTVDVRGLDAGSYIVRLRSTHAPGHADLVQHFVVVP